MVHSKDLVLKTAALTVIALIAFAANSVLCRLALKEGAIDPSSFTVIRLLSGILMFLLLQRLLSRGPIRDAQPSTSGGWRPALFLFLYAASFSWAYVSLDTGTGALVLFGTVQLTLIGHGLLTRGKLHPLEWLGLAVSFSGLVYLLYPSLTTPGLTGFLLMTVAGVAWGLYTLAGRGSRSPLTDTALNFRRTTPFVLVFGLLSLPLLQVSTQGVLLAMGSGMLASALGYAIWYRALPHLSATVAGVSQLSVPVLAALGGVVLVGEALTLRSILAAVAVLGGILIVLLGRQRLNRAAAAGH